MAKVGAQRAAELTGRSKSTIQRAMSTGKLSFETDANGRRLIDVSELERAFGLQPAGNMVINDRAVEQELERAAAMLEMERLKMRVKMLEQQVESAGSQIEDLKGQRDQWQKQASQVLITSQYSQKQAEDLRTEMKDRERRAREARERRTQPGQGAGKLKPENENRPADAEAEASREAGEKYFKGLWKRVKSQGQG